MPIIKSAKKKLRQSKKRKVQKKFYEVGYKKALKRLRKTKKDKLKVLSDAYSKLDKAAKKNVIHKKKASRLKAKAAKLLRIKNKSAK